MKYPLHILWMAILVVLAFSIVGCDSELRTTDDNLPENAPVSYSLHVKPILSDRCFGCHGQDEENRKADLQLHSAETAYKIFDDGSQAIVPGDAEASVVYKRLTSDNPDFVMPPPSSHTSVSDEEIAIIKKWIDDGAKYEKHWAYSVPKRPQVPTLNDVWGENSIDKFTLRKMKEKGLTPNLEAEKSILIRRAFLDITGVIPTSAALDSYLSDNAELAYDKMLDDLFASPRFGEKMASYWLELARYGDTHGYQDDGARTMWPWRDWVIDAFNQNMPFDQFMTEQLAGDLLDNPSESQLIATGFNRNTALNAEGGIIDEEFRVEYIADKIDVTATTFLGQTMACARCHDHKFDPLSQKDYFKMFAFFNNTEETGVFSGVASPPFYKYYVEEEEKRYAAALDEKIESLTQKTSIVEESHLNAVKNKARNNAQTLLNPLHSALTENNAGYFSFDTLFTGARHVQSDANTLMVPGKFGNAIRFSGKGKYTGFIKSIHRPKIKDSEPLSISLWTRQASATDIKVLEDIPEYSDELPTTNVELPATGFMLASNLMNKSHRGFDLTLDKSNRVIFSLINQWPSSALQVISEPLPNNNQWNHLLAQHDGSKQAKGVSLYLNGKKLKTKILKNNLQGPIETGYSYLNFGANAFSKQGLYEGRELDEVRFFKQILEPSSILQLSLLSPWQLEQNIENHFPTELLKANKQYITQKSALFLALEKRKRLENNKAVYAMIMEDAAPADKPVRPTYLLKRGSYDQADESEVLTANIPSYFGDLRENNYTQNRLGLAHWLASDDNPLTARVMVNRLWQLVFGRGLVNTSENFGNQGELPSHPELLDWLAVEFKASGWDIKYMMKLMMMSQTYRQNSNLPQSDSIQDPENIYLSRGGRYRMAAEEIRDSVLQASNLIVDTVGGPSVKPYQPDGLWEAIAAKGQYIQSKEEGLYRRGLYSYWKRTVGVPSMTIFDASTKDYCISRRQSTNTPLQALVLLNDPQYVEAARVLAENAYHQSMNTNERIEYIAKQLLSRPLEQEEYEELYSLFNETYQDYLDEPLRAEQLLQIGDKAYRAAPNELADIAAYTVVSSAVMNLSEFITRQ